MHNLWVKIELITRQKMKKIRLKLGDAFDVTADKKQTNFKKATAIGKYKHAYTASFEIVLKNAKDEKV